jgi:phosphate starvation-inducible PhoH-like protein
MTKKNKQSKKQSSVHKVNGKTPNQGHLLSSIDRNMLTLLDGPAGTGKSFCTTSKACEFLIEGKVSRIILVRPNIPAGRTIGLFPGTMEEKMANWTIPIIEIMKEYFNAGTLDCHLKNGKITIVPFETMRGASFNDAFVILDEAQNTTPHEMEMFLTRIGEGSTIVINGDTRQNDLKDGQESGLEMAIRMANRHKIKNVGVVKMTTDDIVRSGMCKDWVVAFEVDRDVSLPRTFGKPPGII